MTSLPQIRAGAAPQFYRGNATGCLIVHGFMASPSEVSWLGQHVHQALGCTVYLPRLTGHGIDPAHMERMRWEDWYGQALDGYHLLAAQCERVIVIGHSMGGLLALLVAVTQPAAGLVMAAAPISPPDRRMAYAQLLRYPLPYTQHPNEPDFEALIRAEQQRRGEPVIGRVHYVEWASRAVYELYRLMEIGYEVLPRVTLPLLLVYAEQDDTVVAGDDDIIAAHVHSRRVERCRLAAGKHVIFQDAGRAAAFARVAAFVQSLMPGGGG